MGYGSIAVHNIKVRFVSLPKQVRSWTCGTQRCSKHVRVTHLRERGALGDYGRGKHAPYPIWLEDARTGQYLIATAQP